MICLCRPPIGSLTRCLLESLHSEPKHAEKSAFKKQFSEKKNHQIITEIKAALEKAWNSDHRLSLENPSWQKKFFLKLKKCNA